MSTYCVTTLFGLQSVYGAGFETVLSKMNEFVKLLPGSKLYMLDDMFSMAPHVPARVNDATTLATTLNALIAAEGTATSVLIFGDYRVFPPFQIDNPVTDRSIDPDLMVITDNPYGAASLVWSDWLQPRLPVGRLAGGVSDSAEAFCLLLDRQIALRRKRPLRTGYVEFTSRQWLQSSTFVMSVLASPGRVLVSPDDRVTAASSSTFDCQFLYCNLHGFLNDPAWKGYDPQFGPIAIAVTPDAFQPQYVSGTACFTEACYGLQIKEVESSQSCALSLLAAGAAGIVGSTGLAFGTSSVKPQDLIDADALARGFFDLSAGTTLGQRLVLARAQLVRRSMTVDSFVQKTLLQFQLLGDPSYAV